MQVIHDVIYTATYPITLVILLVVGLLSLPLSRVPIRLRSVYVALMILGNPYGFLVWLSSITADLYDNSLHMFNLFLILFFYLLIPCVFFSYFRQYKNRKINSKIWLYSPLIVLFASLGCFFYLVLTK